MTHRILFAALAAFAGLGPLAAAPASAHPGHGDAALSGSWLHYLLEPEHFLALPLLVLAGCAFALVARRARGGPGRLAS
jgi:hypothetical protein